MSMEKIYLCNVCKDKIETPQDSFGLHFIDLKHFTLGGYGCTDGTHICYGCAKQLAEQLSNREIMNCLGI